MRNVIVAIGLGTALSSVVAQAQAPGVLAIQLESTTPTISGGETSRWVLTVKRDPRAVPQPLSFTLESGQEALVRFGRRVVEVPISQERAVIEIGTAGTPIRTPVTITATLSGSSVSAMRAQGQMELVPALIKQVTLGSTSMTGTSGATVAGTVELKAAAPAGGIQLYIGLRALTPPITIRRSYPSRTVVVAAGSRTGTFQIAYNDLLGTFSAPQLTSRDYSLEFEAISRTVEHIVALDPAINDRWIPIVDRAVSASYTLNPLRVVSLTAQPTTLNPGAESLGTITLNAAPGPNERATLSATGAVRVSPLGASCQNASGSFELPVELPLVSGALVQNFKICGKSVTATTASEVRVRLRSGESRVTLTVQP